MVRRCQHCARNRIKLRQNVAELQLFPAEARLESVCIDILGEFFKTPCGNKYLLVIVYRLNAREDGPHEGPVRRDSRKVVCQLLRI